jgi:hypothetical protein
MGNLTYAQTPRTAYAYVPTKELNRVTYSDSQWTQLRYTSQDKNLSTSYTEQQM